MNCIRRYNFKTLSNFRDMGGYFAENGKMVKWHSLFRSASVVDLTNDEWQFLKNELNVKAIIDLRYDYETEAQPYTVPNEVFYRNLPLSTPGFDMAGLSETTKETIENGGMYEYPQMILGDTENLCKILTTISEKLNDGAVVFHCFAGKDRTGVVAATILYLLGVDKSDIIADYEVSYTYNQATVNRRLREMSGKEDLPSLHSSQNQMSALLSLFDEVDLPALLKKNGLSNTTVESLKKQLLL